MSGSEGIAEDIRLLSRSVDDMTEVTRDNSEGALKDRHFAMASAMLLSQFYTGLEQCLEKKLKSANIPLPGKSDRYHSALLTLAIDAQFISVQCIEPIQDLRGFRHYARHAYGGEYRVEEVREKVGNIMRIWSELKTHLLPSTDPLKDAVAVKQAVGKFEREHNRPEISSAPSPEEIAKRTPPPKPKGEQEEIS